MRYNKAVRRAVLMKLCTVAMLLLMPFASISAGAAPALPPHAVILMYHHFGVDRYPTTNIDMDRFRAQLDFLESNDYRIWPLARIVDDLRQGRAIPDHTVAITVDDAYESVYTQAFPLLKRHGWPFTVFVATSYVDRGYSAFMTWDQMREMQKHGASFANHSDSHDRLVLRHKGESEAVWRQRVSADIERAQKRLQQEFGKAPRFFSYPYGEYGEALAGIVRKMGLIGIGQQSGAVGPHSDMRALPRFPMAGSYADMDQFRTKIDTLPLSVSDEAPWDMVTDKARPVLTLTLAPDSDVRLGELRCYASGEGRIEVSGIPGSRDRFTVRAGKPLPAGRSRYNCSAASDFPGRYYWFSHAWLYLPPGVVPPPE